MPDIKDSFQSLVALALGEYKAKNALGGDDVPAVQVRVEVPPKPEMGDLGVPMFPFAKAFRKGPPEIARAVADIISSSHADEAAKIGTVLAVGPYVNVKLDKAGAAGGIIARILEQGEAYGSLDKDGRKPLAGRKVMVEYSSPNTNKPLHLGHMRNDALGESVSRILKKAGAEVFRTNIINNRGIHICKSMLAYKLFHEEKGETPQSLGIKGDHFVGQCYVEYDKWAKDHPEAQEQAEAMLVKWEQGDTETRALWEKMNAWTLDGVKETYGRTGVGFEKLYFESDTYLLGKEIIQKGLDSGIFYKDEDGSTRIDISEAVGAGKDGKPQTKVLLRKDGTSVYITQDLGTAVKRHEDWPYNQMVYVVASEQIYHFKVLFYILRKLGYEWTDKLYHLSYGLVNLPSGRMKSREGTVVDADDLIDSLHADALKAIEERGREGEVGDADSVAEKVALAALHYYLLQVAPVKDMMFDPAASLSFTGNTGPYLQYMGARIASILRKASEQGLAAGSKEADVSLLSHESEWALLKDLQLFPELVARAAENLDPSIIATYLYDVCKDFSAFYRDCPIVAAAEQNKPLALARLTLASCTLTVLKNAMELVLVPYLDKM